MKPEFVSKNLHFFLHSGFLPGGPGVAELLVHLVHLFDELVDGLGQGGVVVLHPGLEDEGEVMEGDICLVLVVLLVLDVDASDPAVHGGRDLHLPFALVTVDGDVEGGIGHILLLDLEVGVAEGWHHIGEDIPIGDAALNLPAGETYGVEDGIEGLIEGLGDTLDLLDEGMLLGFQTGDEQLTLVLTLEVLVGDEDFLILGDFGDVPLDLIEVALKGFLTPGKSTLAERMVVSHIHPLVLLTGDTLIVVGHFIEGGEEAIVGADDFGLLHGVMSFN